MIIPTEPIGSIPRPAYLIDALSDRASGRITEEALKELSRRALKETVTALEQTGSPVISDGEQTKPSFATYPIHGAQNLSAGGVVIPFKDGHTRQLPVLASGPFKYQRYADDYLREARLLSSRPVKQAVISASAMSLLYPSDGIPNYSREQFVNDLLSEAEKDIRRCLDSGAYNVQIDFTEARLAIKLDPSKSLLKMFIDLNNQLLGRFTVQERKRIGIHSCPGGDHDSTHSADVDYGDLLPELFQLEAGNFYLTFAGEKDKTSVLKQIKSSLKTGQRVFLGVTDVLNPRIETPEEVSSLLVQAATYIPIDQLGSCDDCGFSPFADDRSTAREIAFSKIKARVLGTQLAASKL
ncbi:cobalamin-independent methionine synthase II family protein [Chryseolinea sp. T2]|uniref:cobalamin-independent methionine synthase II family protein n=1 Tax=Chryseolinea sp. T2 TaxID=3129255 RepID=UPI003078A289